MEGKEEINAIISADSDGKIVFWNEGAKFLFGYSAEEILGRSITLLMSEPFREVVQRSMEQWRTTGEAPLIGKTVEFRGRRKDGREFPAEISFAAGKAGEDSFYAIVIRDATERVQVEEALSRADKEKAITLDVISELVVYQDLAHRVLWANRAAGESVGVHPKQLEGRLCHEIWHQRSQPCTDCPVARARETGSPQEGRITSPDGRKWFIRGYPVRNTNGEVVSIVEVAQDITQWMRMVEELQKSEERYRTLFEGVPVGLYRSTPHGEILEANLAMAQILGYSDREALLGVNAIDLFVNPEDRRREGYILEKQGVVDHFETQLRRRDGTPIWVRDSVRAVRDESGRIVRYEGSLQDISKRKQAEEELAYMATHDALTGLPNRWLFNDRLNMALAQARRNQWKLALMLLDLDHFKDVNDTLGHSVGDKLLQAVGERLRDLPRKSDTIARMGGDEFLLLLTEIACDEDAVRFAQKVLEAIRKPFVIEGSKLRVTTSIGIAIYPDDGKDSNTLMKNADIAMYRAKKQGRDTYQRYTSVVDTNPV